MHVDTGALRVNNYGWFEVLTGFYFAICIFCNFEIRQMLRIPVAHEPSGSHT